MRISKKIYASIWNSDLNVFSSIIKKIAFITIAIGLSSIILSKEWAPNAPIITVNTEKIIPVLINNII